MIIKVIIIEDEALAAKRLRRFLSEMEDTFEVITELKSVKEASAWFTKNAHDKYDLIFSDIQLLDGISFEIFEQTDGIKPIIFITAYDEYLLKAFKTYSIDYLLKPYLKEDLELALQKFKKLFWQETNVIPDDTYTKLLQNLHAQIHFPTFLTYQKDRIRMVKSEEVAFFSLDYQTVFAHLEKEKCLLSESLNQLQEKLPSRHFFRANRQFIVHRAYIKEISNFFGGRLKLTLTVNHPEILISKDLAKSFKNWLQD